MKKILVINGPNLNLLGTRDPEIYGNKNLDDVEKMLNEYLIQNSLDNQFKVEFFQSNHEGDLIDYIQKVSVPKLVVFFNLFNYIPY